MADLDNIVVSTQDKGQVIVAQEHHRLVSLTIQEKNNGRMTVINLTPLEVMEVAKGLVTIAWEQAKDMILPLVDLAKKAGLLDDTPEVPDC